MGKISWYIRDMYQIQFNYILQILLFLVDFFFLLVSSLIFVNVSLIFFLVWEKEKKRYIFHFCQLFSYVFSFRFPYLCNPPNFFFFFFISSLSFHTILSPVYFFSFPIYPFFSRSLSYFHQLVPFSSIFFLSFPVRRFLHYSSQKPQNI